MFRRETKARRVKPEPGVLKQTTTKLEAVVVTLRQLKGVGDTMHVSRCVIYNQLNRLGNLFFIGCERALCFYRLDGG